MCTYRQRSRGRSGGNQVSLLCRCSKVSFFRWGESAERYYCNFAFTSHSISQILCNSLEERGSKPCEWKFTRTIKVAPEKLLSTKQLHSILAANVVLYSGQFVSDLMGVHSGKHMDSLTFISGQFSTDVPCNILAFWILCCWLTFRLYLRMYAAVPTKSPPSATMMLLLDMMFSRLYNSFSGFKCFLRDSCDLRLFRKTSVHWQYSLYVLNYLGQDMRKKSTQKMSKS